MWCALSLCWRVQQLMVFRICVCLWEAGSGLILLIYKAFKKKNDEESPTIHKKRNQSSEGVDG